MRFDARSDNEVRITFSFGKEFHVIIWKTMIPLMVFGTICACILRLAKVF
jgi:hypothetical protein